MIDAAHAKARAQARLDAMLAEKQQCWQQQSEMKAERRRLYPVGDEDPVPGYYRIKLVKGGPFVGAEIKYEPPLDPVTGEVLDRSWLWRAIIDGVAEPIRGYQPTRKVWWIWERGEMIDEAMYRFLLEDRAWARKWAKSSAEANPTKTVDLGQEPIAI